MSEIDYELAKEYGHYQTRDGKPARFLTRLRRHQDRNEVWLADTGETEIIVCMYSGGRYYSDGSECAYDIIPIPSPPKQHTTEGWFNFYADGTVEGPRGFCTTRCKMAESTEGQWTWLASANGNASSVRSVRPKRRQGR